MKIYTPCWGEWHIELLEKALLKSLMWEKNRAEIEGCEWIFTTETEYEATRIKQIVEALPLKTKINIKIYLIRGISRSDVGMSLMHTLVPTMEECLKEKQPLLMATPDFIFSNGAITAFKELCSDLGDCATIAHMRVLPEVLPLISETAPTNTQLMQIGFNHPHSSWTEAEERKNTFIGGFEWRRFGAIRAVRHYLPSPFYAKFIYSDPAFYKQSHDGFPPGFGLWDHKWPTELLKNNRLRFIGGSDLACMIEVTKPMNNTVPIKEGIGYHRKEFHNNIQSQFVSVFRGEE